MNIFESLFQEVEVPELIPVRFRLPVGKIRREDIRPAIEASLAERDLLGRIRPGSRVAVTVGSREIPHMDEIARSVVELVKEQGAEPFLFPAMEVRPQKGRGSSCGDSGSRGRPWECPS